MTTNRKTDTAVTGGTEVLIPLAKLKKSPRNARRTPHSEAAIEAYAASIAAKGILQNLVVEPERDTRGAETGFYLVTIGEGRRLAQLLRVKRKQIKKSEPVRCVIDTTNDPHEISLDENVTREAMNPADQFEAFRKLAEERGLGAEDIAARFGVTAHVVRQRLRLGAVSPRLMQVYRDSELTLEQLMAYAMVEDHARQEHVFDNLPSWNRDALSIRRELTRSHVAASDRRAIFVGAEAYAEAGGTILRDLFTEDRGGFLEDAALLDQLVIAKLERVAAEVQAEGWKWTAVHIDYPHAHGLRRAYPQPVELSPADQTAYETTQEVFNSLSAEWEGAEELPDDVDQRFGELETEMERIDALRHAYDADDLARGGVFVMLGHEGTARIERGFIRPEDEKAKAEAQDAEEADAVAGADSEDEREQEAASDEDEDDGAQAKPLSDALVRDLTAHRTLGLRLAVGEQPYIALIAVTHALAAQAFYRATEASCLDVRATSASLASHASGIEDTAAGKTLADRHAGWAADMPRDVSGLWGFVAGLDHTSVMALLAHCVSLTVDAVRMPWERKPLAHKTADRLATVTNLDMAAHWSATAASYFGRVTKANILCAVREGVGDETAERIADFKKQPMADTAEKLLIGTGWLPTLLRTQPAATAEADDSASSFPIAAE